MVYVVVASVLFCFSLLFVLFLVVVVVVFCFFVLFILFFGGVAAGGR